ncbi:hypothetical protein FB446DRAFT_748622 [Lentinula raphanica]|nr:hypothetical protein C8R42DRAFT_713460 [Lentinula raphanica]KAJ3769269.1 hypothetical protein FB446DRAFT_748622 [Lentinula raphanica]
MSNLSGLITRDTYPELNLSDREVDELNTTLPEMREGDIQMLREMKPFLAYFPAETIPNHLIDSPTHRTKVKLSYGWSTTWEAIADYIRKHHPKELELLEGFQETNETSSLVSLGIRFTSTLAELCHLPTLKIKNGWADDRELCACIAICKNESQSLNQRDQILASEGVQKLKEIFQLNNSPMWFVDGLNYNWPHNFEGLTRAERTLG